MSIEHKRILSITNKEQPYSQTAEILLDNSDGKLTNLDFKGHKVVLNFGLKTKAGEEGKAMPPLWVISQQLESSGVDRGRLLCRLELAGIFDLMAEEGAKANYIPDEDDTKMVKTLLTEIITAELSCFSHCKAYEVVFDSEDSLIKNYRPKDGFRIYAGGSRLASIRRLLDYTRCVPRVESDGKIHILKPTTTGTSYTYQYSLKSGHTFFAKAYRKRLVIPNVIVVQSNESDEDFYQGVAKDNESIAALDGRELWETHTGRLQSDDEAEDMAEAILSKYQLWAEMGAAEVPMNVDAEVFDYVKVTDERENDYRVGNIGSLTRTYNPLKPQTEYTLKFSFGGWLSVRKTLKDLETYSDTGAYFSRLTVKDAYIENLLITNIDAVWIDPDGNVDLSKIGDTLDHLPDGEVYARVQSMHLDAGQLKLDEHVLYANNYDPTAKFDPSHDSLDNIPEGVLFRRVRSAALTAAGLVLLDKVVVGTYGLVKSTDISAGHIKLEACEGDIDDIDNGSIYGKVRKTDISAGHLKLTSQASFDGEWYDESGIIIDADEGLFIDGLSQNFIDGGLSDIFGWLYADENFGFLVIANDGDLTLGASGTGKNHLRLAPDDDIEVVGADILPDWGVESIGASGNRFAYGWFDNLPASPIPTTNSALSVIKKIKPPKVMEGKHGLRHYFTNDDIPDELKCDMMKKIRTNPVYQIKEFINSEGHKRKRRVLVQPGHAEFVPTGKKEPEYLRTIGVLVQAVRELTDKVEALEAK